VQNRARRGGDRQADDDPAENSGNRGNHCFDSSEVTRLPATIAAMAGRRNHYALAFEAFLRSRSIPFVNVDEAKRALFSNSRLKSFDFVVYSKKGKNLLVDLNGRSHSNRGKVGGFQTWTGEEDVADLIEWEKIFGEEFVAVVTFVYWMKSARSSQNGMFRHRDRWYQMMGIELGDYRRLMRRRSAKWETVSLPAADFRSLARPLESWL
jgi:hypothetical protein